MRALCPTHHLLWVLLGPACQLIFFFGYLPSLSPLPLKGGRTCVDTIPPHPLQHRSKSYFYISSQSVWHNTRSFRFVRILNYIGGYEKKIRYANYVIKILNEFLFSPSNANEGIHFPLTSSLVHVYFLVVHEKRGFLWPEGPCRSEPMCRWGNVFPSFSHSFSSSLSLSVLLRFFLSFFPSALRTQHCVTGRNKQTGVSSCPWTHFNIQCHISSVNHSTRSIRPNLIG